MEPIVEFNEAAASFIVRVFLGILFFFQGYDAIFNVKVKQVVETFRDPFSSKGIPSIFTTIGSYFTSYAQFIGGLLLILGLFQYFALYLLAINLIIASIAFGITTPMWDMKHLFPRMVLLLTLLILPESWSVWSMDNVFFSESAYSVLDIFTKY